MKKMLFFAMALCSVLTFSSCEENDNGCAKAEVRFTCISDNPYRLFINGQVEGTVNGNSFIERELNEGLYRFEVEQISGFLLFPTTREIEKVLTCGERFEFVFP